MRRGQSDLASRTAVGDPAVRTLDVVDVTKRFGGNIAVDHVSFSLRPGTITAIVGPNGAGKTTLFDVISGFLEPNEGIVTYAGQKVSGLASYEVARRRVGRVFQDVRLFRELTLLDNLLVSNQHQVGENPVRVFFQPHAIRRQEGAARDKARTLLEFVGLDDRAGQLAGTLSGGQQRVLAIARVLMLDAEVLLLDEPTAGLDPERVVEIVGLVRRLERMNKIVLIVEHRLELVGDLAGTVICLDQGRKILEGPPDFVLRHQDLLRAYLGA